MREEWQLATLDQLGKLVTGKTPATSEPENYGGSIPFVSPSDMQGQRIINEVARYLSDAGASKVKNSIIPARAVMVSCIGSDMGKAAIAARRCVTNQQINSIIASSDNDPLFIYYNLSARKDEIRGLASGSAQPILNKSAFGRMRIDLPPLPEQRAIAATLGALDDKIELNRKMNATLETMARALFRDWFVDFGPTRAKMEGRAPYLSPDLWRLFPARLDAEGKPEGWEVFRLGQLAEHHTRSISPSASPEELFEHFSLPAFDKGQSPSLDRGDAIKSNKTQVPPKAILLSKLNPEIPRVWLPEAANGRRQIASTEFLAYTGKNGAQRGLLFCLFCDEYFRGLLQSMVTGTSKSHQRISPPDLLRREALLGTAELFAQFENTVASLLNRVLANRAESRTLAQTRDLLLPRLMSGELRVTQAERMVEAAQ